MISRIVSIIACRGSSERLISPRRFEVVQTFKVQKFKDSEKLTTKNTKDELSRKGRQDNFLKTFSPQRHGVRRG